MSIAYPRQRLVRLVALVPVVVAIVCLFVARAHIASVGHTYEYVIDAFPGQAIAADQILVDPAGMAEVESVRMREDGTTVATIRALADGEGTVLVQLPEGGMASALRVRDGVVIADGIEFTGWESILVSLILIASVTGIVCLWAFFRMLRDAWFGYQMAAYAGAGIFFSLQAVTFLQIACAGSVTSFGELAQGIITIADRFVYLSLAPVSVAAALVALSNLALVRREGRGLTNMLGVAFSLAFVGACLAWRWIASQADLQYSFESWVFWWFAGSLAAVAISYGLAFLAGTSLTAWLAARHMPRIPFDYVAILGCGLMPDGSPTPLLAGRVDAARHLAARQEEAGHPLPTLVPSGGQGSDEPWSEAEAMRRYLTDAHDPCRVVLEDRSANTRQNLAFCRDVIRADAQAQNLDPDEARVAFATTNYHVMRGYVYAHAAGIAAEGVASPTKAYFWPNAFLREFVGLVVARAVPILISLVCVELLYAAALYATTLGGV